MNDKRRFEKLFEPGYIGKVKTRNRLIKSGAQIALCNDREPYVNEATKSYYEGIAKGGIGLLIVESPIIDYPLGGRNDCPLLEHFRAFGAFVCLHRPCVS